MVAPVRPYSAATARFFTPSRQVILLLFFLHKTTLYYQYY